MLQASASVKPGLSVWKSRAVAIVGSIIITSSFLMTAQAADGSMSKPHHDSMAAKGDSKAVEMHGAMMKGMKEMEGMKSTGHVDHDFAMMMKKHHESALDMAQVQLQHGKDAKMRSMAKKIIAAQKKEIKEFDQWLAKHK
jgi:uncharacterized protein (DUF305 family)